MLGISLLVFLLIALVYLAWHVITWIFIAIFLAAALNPAVGLFEARGLRRGLAAAIVFVVALLAVVGVGFLVLPPLVEQIRRFIEALPDLVDDLTAGRGPLGFLETEYDVVDRIRAALKERGPGDLFGFTQPVIEIARGVITTAIGAVTIAFLTFFMLLEGPRTVRQFLELLPTTVRPRWERVGGDIYRTIGGYVSGNLLISLIAGTASTIALFAVGSDYALALGILVAILDLIPLAGATIAAIVASTVIFVETDWIRGLVIVGFFILYQQTENHFLQPVIYGRTVELSPLAVLVAVLIGAELAGVLGALAAIPIAGSIQAIARELLIAGRNRPGHETVLVEQAEPPPRR